MSLEGRERPLQPPDEHHLGCDCYLCRRDRADRDPDDAYERYVQRELDADC